MIEGLAVWALFIYLLRLVGMPWNKVTQSFAYIGGISWLMFVWVGLINYTPMDISGGSVVQSPHIQLRPDSPNVTGKVSKIYVDPNQTIQKGQLIYEIDATPYQIAFNQALIAESAAKVALESANGDVEIAKASYQSMLKDITVSHSQLASAREDYLLQKKMLERYREQNRVVKNTITQADMDKQSTTVQVANQNLTTIESQLAKKQVDADKAKLAITQAQLTITQRENDLGNARETVAKARWDLNSTKVYAPADGFVTNFILREGQRIAMMPRLQMYTNEKYVLMRVNHQAIRNIKAGQLAEFASSVYPGKVFSATVEGIVEATGEAQSNLLGFDQNVTATTVQNLRNKHHFVRLKIEEPEGYDVPVGSVGLAWVSGEKPISFLAFLDVIRGIILRMKSQLYFFYSI
ncbi:HlyD family secretion protein [Vibrio metoecus]|uniref:Multidrug transporter n=1 Tax=Vibrio metoecus TaxID=1481663 RepID=A0ABR4RW57_VIBMT|nr:biotin/lipoyl-binding protein [Vibrio metoecus]EEX64570.1 multidrug resistance efflux pump [Vibrio metoecus]KDO13948.1 multidrug transporter [Vibrio metoecus]KQB04902.1 multidrug transporter [Vibrio metoecus]PAR29484.1 HlyD family secretion protein [Vibrio metoecus]PAR30657.1 HlyD family secretion protein [Vibrio metoecus]